MVALKKPKEFDKIYGRKEFLYHCAIATSILFGGLIAHYNLEWAVAFSVIPLLLSSIFASLLPEAKKIESTEELKYWDYFKSAFQEVKGNKVLVFLFLYLLGISIFENLEEFEQLYYEMVKLPIYAFGIVGFIWSSITAIGTYHSYRLSEYKWIYIVFPLISGALLLAVGNWTILAMIPVLILADTLIIPLLVLNEANIHKEVKGTSRATIGSISSFLKNFFGLFILPLMGIISSTWGLNYIYLSTGVFMIVFSAWVFGRRSLINRH